MNCSCWKQYGRSYRITSLSSSHTPSGAWCWPRTELILWLGVTLWLHTVNPRHYCGTSTVCCESNARLTVENTATPHKHTMADSQNMILPCLLVLLSCWNNKGWKSLFIPWEEEEMLRGSQTATTDRAF